ncbi:hypothetical protein [Micromonospora sp. NBC_01813]|uniref:hypothetical protein n=1 Tax=Micromonospora sp. NBC_01813 TaxID=2975988 RepID=UPI002DD85E9E|nr:hypothetical protein [Micromonospora sp. NBC_01813]WSA07635.1 hypothetical protein OG958_25870 [Micromonospora sp. NBC_01813]
MLSAHQRRRADRSRTSRQTSAACRALLIGTLLIGATLSAGGCGRPPELRGQTPSDRTLPSTGTTAPATPDPPPRTSTPAGGPTTPTPTGSPGFGERVAVDCAGRPSADQVVALLRRSTELLPAGARVSVPVAPRCAGTWQYTVVQIPDREPLQVVTEGSPTSFSLVTAGTDVCVIPVRVGAPTGIRTLACESVPIPPATP